jgi:hypothetical protein
MLRLPNHSKNLTTTSLVLRVSERLPLVAEEAIAKRNTKIAE